MNMTLDLMAAFINCRYKAFLQCTRERGTVTPYELLERDMADAYRKEAISRLTSRLDQRQILSSPPSLEDALASRHRLVLNATSIADGRSVVFPAIERLISGHRRAECVPVMFAIAQRCRPLRRWSTSMLKGFLNGTCST